MAGVTPVVPPPILEVDLRRKPLLARKATWAAVAVALLVGGAFWAGSRGLLWRPSAPAPAVISTAAPAAPSPEILDLAIQSNPSGAEVFVAGENEALGKTPFRKKFEYREDKSTFLVFRLPGYRELTHEVRPDWSGLVVLGPVPGQPVAEVAPSTPGKAGKGGSPVRSSHRKIRKENDLSDKQRMGRNLGRAQNPF
jgi:hypothetical protein